MSEKLKCPNCGSPKVRSYDGSVCYHPSKKSCEENNEYGWVENQQQFYMVCDGCEHAYQLEATIILDDEYQALREKAEAFDDLKSGQLIIKAFAKCKSDEEALQVAQEFSDDVRIVADEDSAWIEPVNETVQQNLDSALYSFKTYEGWFPLLGTLIKAMGLEIIDA